MKNERRSFIKKSIAAAAVAAFSPNVLLAATRPVKEKLGVALVGLGYYSTDLIAPGLLNTKHCELKGIVTGTPSKIPTWQDKYGIADKNIYSYDNYDDIANNPDIDVIYVVLPPSMHREYTVRGAETGKQMWCEKPMAPSVADCQAMIDACNKNKVRLAIGYRCQHDPNIQAYQKVVKEQRFGKVMMVNSAAGYKENRTDHWKQSKAMGGGVMGDMGVYAIQGARMATGEEPISVTAHTMTTRPEIYHEVEETATYLLRFPSGAMATCQSSFGVKMNHLQVNYEKGWLKMEPQTGYGGNRGSMSDGTEIYTPINRQQPLQMDNDALALMNNTPYIAHGEEGLADIRVVEAVLKSGSNGSCEVKL
ncbi:MAG: glucose-fructose oxidoreductase [Arcticibacterium sp.]|jgi:glucose-fructose oxidoreductase